MRDIVATIQPEQDEVVRTDLEVSVCVQGAPGTGKTAVGLHRAAYLLYAHRDRLKRTGVLVLGPNRAFLHYISAVLPTLGEVDVEQTTIESLLAREIKATDDPAAAGVKHDRRMADVLRNAVYARVQRPDEAVVVADGSYKWRVNQHEFAEMVTEARVEATAYLLGRERVIARIVAALQRQAEARGQNCNGIWQRRMARAAKPAVEAVWPNIKADEVLAELLSDREQLNHAAAGILTTDEQDLIAWPRPRKAKSARWTAADAVLLDEVSALLERGPTYGHVIVDEAQDLSPMQCRAIARRSEHGSITVLGDLAQGTTPWAATDWITQLEHLGKPTAQVIALTTGYRVPAAVVELANRLLVPLNVSVPPTISFRTDGKLTVTQVDDLPTACVTAVQAALAEEGSIGVIAADHQAAALADALKAAGIEVVPADGDGRVTVVPGEPGQGARVRPRDRGRTGRDRRRRTAGPEPALRHPDQSRVEVGRPAPPGAPDRTEVNRRLTSWTLPGMRTSTLGVLMGESSGQLVRTDRELWERLRLADEQALTDLFHRHSDAVYNFAFRRTASWSQAEDVVQLTFTALWRRARPAGSTN